MLGNALRHPTGRLGSGFCGIHVGLPAFAGGAEGRATGGCLRALVTATLGRPLVAQF